MKKAKKQLITLLMAASLLPLNAFANTNEAGVAASSMGDIVEAAKYVGDKSKGSLAEKLWEQAKHQLANSKIKAKVNLPTLELAKGLNVGGGYRIESEKSIAGKYSGIDIWEVNLSAYPQLFGIDNPTVGVGFSASRQITYIQQFDSQRDSLLRVPYDPISKMPLKSSIFFDKHKNIFTGEEEMILKPGDFIGYRAPMTLSIGKGFGQLASTALGISTSISAGLSYVISGEFDVHIFVMNNNMVRVKLLAIKDKSKGASVGVSLLGFSGIGELIINKIIDTNLLSLYMNKTNTDLFTADYIFNLNNDESKVLYDRFIGSKLHIFSKDVIIKQIKAANPFASDSKIRELMMADLTEINNVSGQDLNKPYTERRVLKLSNAHNESETFSMGSKISLFKILKSQNSTSKTGSKITLFAQNDDSVKAKFKLDAFSVNNNFEFLVWGDKHVITNSLLTQTDVADNPINFTGLQNSRTREDKALKKKEYDALLEKLKRLLPEAIYTKLELPNWDFSKGSVSNAFVQQDITFNENLFKMSSNVSEETILATLKDVLANYGKLKSKPMGAKDFNNGDDRDPVMEDFQRGKYLEAYADWELRLIPQKLAIALNSAYSFKDRYAEFSYLYEKVPLFSEISMVLLLKLIPAADLEKVVIARLVMSAKRQKTVIAEYPTTEAFNTSNIFREILAQNNFINDRSYNLRYYLKEDGTQYSIDEIMLEKNK